MARSARWRDRTASLWAPDTSRVSGRGEGGVWAGEVGVGVWVGGVGRGRGVGRRGGCGHGQCGAREGCGWERWVWAMWVGGVG